MMDDVLALTLTSRAAAAAAAAASPSDISLAFRPGRDFLGLQGHNTFRYFQSLSQVANVISAAEITLPLVKPLHYLATHRINNKCRQAMLNKPQIKNYKKH